MANKEDYYKTLGVEKGATEAEIKSAFRRLAKKYHPDVSQEADAEARFRVISEAYEVLKDTTKRQSYDQFGHAGVDGQFGQGGGFGGFGDFASNFGFGGGGGFSNSSFGGFEDIFGGIFGNRGQRRSTEQKERNIFKQIVISLKDAFLGTSVDVKFNAREKCAKCNGSKADSSSDIKRCNNCNGRGVVTKVQRTFLGNIQQNVVCSACSGQGETISKKCSACSGQGFENKQKKITVKIPAGIDNGQRIRLSGKGHNDTQAGDVYIEVYVEEHPFFKRDDDDIFVRVPISYENVVVGTKIQIPTFTGSVTMKIPSGTQPNQFFRIKNEGLPHLNKKTRGDMYVEVQVIIPKNPKQEEKQKLKEIQNINENKTFIEYAKKIQKSL